MPRSTRAAFGRIMEIGGAPMTERTLRGRERLVARGRKLEYFTVGWNCLEGIVALVSGLVAGSVALVGFGLDSFIEVTSGAALLWRLHRDRDPATRERAEHLSLRIVGSCSCCFRYMWHTIRWIRSSRTKRPKEAFLE